ncbi:hypothetical protein ACSW8S_15135 (plasmid) [Clostridium perfringens]
MQENDTYIVKKEINLSNGIIPIGAIINIKDSSEKDLFNVSITPFITLNTRTSKDFKVTKEFINDISSKIKPL